MKLLSSLKQKKRYIVFEILSEKDTKFSLKEVELEVNNALKDFLGQLGISKAAPIFIKEKFNQTKQRFIVKANNKFVNEVKTALTLIKNIKNKGVIIKSVITSGTIKKAHSKLHN